MAVASDLRQFEAQARKARQFAQATERLSDNELRGRTMDFRCRLADGGGFEDLLPEALASVREAARRAVGTPHTDVQLASGVAVHAGQVVEMKDGEGKTLTAILAAYLHALADKGVHLVTLDDQLARRGAGQAAAVLGLLGLRVAVINAGSSKAERAEAYAADVTYGAYRQFGYDYLRDNLAWQLGERVQRNQHAVVLDEIDSILIDRAGELVVMSGRVEPNVGQYRKLAQLTALLRSDRHYAIDAATGSVTLTELGAAEAEAFLGIDGLLRPEHAGLAGSLADAIRAREWYRQGQDYVVVDGEVTVAGGQRAGRLSRTTRFGRGIRQAIEASHGMHISAEEPILARISVAGYFRLYRNTAGLTATAMPAAEDFNRIYGLEVTQVPVGMPTGRVDHSDLLYGTQQAKLDDLIRGVTLRRGKGQPVVIAAPSAETSGWISRLLSEAGIAHAVLSPGDAENTAEAMAAAGRLGVVTVICGTAGRGYPIRLGGDPTADNVGLQRAGPEKLRAQQVAAGSADATEREHVIKAGGLAVLVSERSQSRRTDDWLRGLAGQRGEPGESRFFIAKDDPFLAGLHDGLPGALWQRRRTGGVPVKGLMTRVINQPLRDAEAQAAQARRATLGYEDVGDEQSLQAYQMRRAILEARDLHAHARQMIGQAVEASVAANPDQRRLRDALAALYPVSLADAELALAGDGPTAAAAVTAWAQADALAAYDRREQELGPALLRELEGKLIPGVIDREWREHLLDLDRLRELATAGGSGHGDPLDSYRHLAAESYSNFLCRVQQRIVSNLFFLEIPL
jgi:preprotein translocase subunit SecA